MYRSRQPFRTARHSASSNRTRDRKGITPYSERRELVPAHGSPVRSFAAVRSQSLFLAVGAILRCTNKHLDKVVVERVIQLSLKAPFELRIVEVARVQVKVIGVDRNTLVLELDDDLNAIALVSCGEVQQWMLVQTELS